MNARDFKPGLLRLIAVLAGIAACLTGAILLFNHQDILSDPKLAEERGTELLPAMTLLVSGLVAVAGAVFVRRETRALTQLLVVVGVLCLGAVSSEALIRAKVEPARVEAEVLGPLVEVVRVAREDVPVRITGYGTARARQRSRIVPQVEGRVVRVHPNLVSGGLVPAGEVLIEIDPTDYELAVERAETDVLASEASLETVRARIEEAEARVEDARADLARIRTLDASGVSNDREMEKALITERIAVALMSTVNGEYRSAQAGLDAAKLRLREEQLKLERTRISLSFDAVVVEEQVDEGQFVSIGQSLAEVYGTEAVEVPVPLDDRELQWFDRIPVAGANTGGETDAWLPRASVTAQWAGRSLAWEGRVARVEAQVDERSRMVTAVIEVRDPWKRVDASHTPLVPGMFVDAEIEGRTIAGVVPVPRHAVQAGDEVWVVEDGGVLRVKPVVVVRRDRERAYIRDGLEPGDLVIVSPMDTVTDGMRVRMVEAERAGVFSEAAADTPGDAR